VRVCVCVCACGACVMCVRDVCVMRVCVCVCDACVRALVATLIFHCPCTDFWLAQAVVSKQYGAMITARSTRVVCTMCCVRIDGPCGAGIVVLSF